MFIKNNLIKPLQIKPKTRIKYSRHHIAYPATQMYLFGAYLISRSRTWKKSQVFTVFWKARRLRISGRRLFHRSSMAPCRENMTLYSSR